MDLSECLRRAVRAARRGDVDSLEVELSNLRTLPAEAVVGLRVQLRGVARSVRAHPSYKSAPAAQAG